MMEFLYKNRNKIGVVLPLFIYDHSGITMSTTRFSCPWDTSHVGYIYITKEKMRYEYSYKRVSQKLIKRVTEYLKSEVEEYDHYLTGDAYGYRITNTETEEDLDSCWGFLGDSEYCMEEAVSIVNHMIGADKHGQLELELK